MLKNMQVLIQRSLDFMNLKTRAFNKLIAFVRFFVYNRINWQIFSVRYRRMEYITAKEAAEKWNISQRRVQVLCEQGRIKGAVRLGWAWAIPKEADKPLDARMKSKTRNQR